MTFDLNKTWVVAGLALLCFGLVAFFADPAWAGFVDSIKPAEKEFSSVLEWLTTGSMGKLIIVLGLFVGAVCIIFMSKVSMGVRAILGAVALGVIWDLASGLQSIGGGAN